MKRIFCNEKLKKIIISLLVVMILICYVKPSVVLAATTKIEYANYEFSYQDWISLKDNNEYKEIIEKYGVDKYEQVIKEESILATAKRIYSEEYNANEDNAKKLAEDLLKNSPSGVLISARLELGTNFIGSAVCKFEIITEKSRDYTVPKVALKKEANDNTKEVNMKYYDLLNWSIKSDDEVYEEVIAIIMKDDHLIGKENIGGGYTARDAAIKLLELNDEEIVLTLIGKNDAYTITAFKIDGKDTEIAFREVCNELDIPYDSEEAKKDSADLGGILLSPLFALVNFVADAVIDNLGGIMDDKGLSTGLGVLSPTKTPQESNKEYFEYEVDMNRLNVVGFVQYPTITYTPERIFAGGVDLLSIDFISGKIPEKDENGNFVKDEDGNIKYTTNSNSDWKSIRTVISDWYKVLRMIAIIGFLSVLIYTGIKIIISANAKDKAKYKEWIMNWFIGVAILFSMHYIMSFIISVIGEINKLLSGVCQEILIVNGSEKSVTNLMGLVRFMIQAEDFYLKIGYEIMYIALIVYTCKFTFVYLKRVLNMAFLTLIAPIVALTYPIDKLNDGNAQGFNMWLKEYIFNALLQPMHYIMYYILVGSAVSIAASNPLYGIVVLAFMAEAEKLLKKIFGFDKAGGGTVGGMAGAFAAGAIASNVKNIARMAGGAGGKNNLPGGDKANSYEGIKPNNNAEADRALFDSDEPVESVVPQMAEAYDEKFGTDEYDPAERESMQREINEPEGLGLEGEELRSYLKENLGMEDDEIEAIMKEREGGNESEDEETPQNSPQTPPSPHTTTQTPPLSTQSREQSSTDGEREEDSDGADESDSEQNNSSRTPIRDMARKLAETKHGRGMIAVGKKIMKPYWDFDQKGEDGKEYNKRRLMRKIARGAVRGTLGVGLGITAAAVQAGISITDGKYKPSEGFASFVAGFAGGGQIAKGVEGLYGVYKDGMSEGEEKEITERKKEKWADDEKIREYNAKKYGGSKYNDKERANIIRIQQQLLEQGMTDPDKMHQCIQYMKKVGGDNWYEESKENNDLIRKARTLSTLEDDLASYGLKKAPTDTKDRENYIKAKAKNKKEETQYGNMLDELNKFRNANSNVK